MDLHLSRGNVSPHADGVAVPGRDRPPPTPTHGKHSAPGIAVGSRSTSTAPRPRNPQRADQKFCFALLDTPGMGVTSESHRDAGVAL